MTFVNQDTATVVLNNNEHKIPAVYNNPGFIYVDATALLQAFIDELFPTGNSDIPTMLSGFFKDPYNLKNVIEWERDHNIFFNVTAAYNITSKANQEFDVCTNGIAAWENIAKGHAMTLVDSKPYIIRDVVMWIVARSFPDLALYILYYAAHMYKFGDLKLLDLEIPPKSWL